MTAGYETETVRADRVSCLGIGPMVLVFCQFAPPQRFIERRTGDAKDASDLSATRRL